MTHSLEMGYPIQFLSKSLSTLFLFSISGPVATELGQRFGYRRTVILAGALLGIGFIGAAFATHIAHVYVCYAIAGTDHTQGV